MSETTVPNRIRLPIATHLVAWGMFVLVIAGRVEAGLADGGVGSQPGKARALIVVGLPGDLEHKAKWSETVRRWRAWLTGPLGFEAAFVTIVADRDVVEDSNGPATREAIAAAVADIRRVIQPQDRLWVFWLGHAGHDGEHLALHLPGADLQDEEWGALFRGLACREQVFWMTSCGSGWLLKSLAAKGRIVVAATERDQEFNETEFPQALAEIADRPPPGLAAKEGTLSLGALLIALGQAIEARYQADQRVPTEHAQLDDNGDGLGTDIADLPQTPKPTADGALAARVFVKIPASDPNR
jgi:hypothetical protein